MAPLRSGLIHVCLALLIAGGWSSPDVHAIQDDEVLIDDRDLGLLGRKAPDLNPGGTWLI